jgi:hypothetical protein
MDDRSAAYNLIHVQLPVHRCAHHHPIVTSRLPPAHQNAGIAIHPFGEVPQAGSGRCKVVDGALDLNHRTSARVQQDIRPFQSRARGQCADQRRAGFGHVGDSVYGKRPRAFASGNRSSASGACIGAT